jgi:hypothetical protein
VNTPDQGRLQFRQFCLKFKPKVINGIQILPIPDEATERHLNILLGRTSMEVGPAIQRAGQYCDPDKSLLTHIIMSVC